MKKIIVAYDKQRGIGAENDLLWLKDLPDDLQHFKELTMGAAIIMGRKTFDSIGRPLPGRQNIVISRNMEPREDVAVARSLDEAYQLASREDTFIIGGGQIYELALASVDEIEATEVQDVFPAATVFFPALGDEWKEVVRTHHSADERNKYSFDFVTYRRSR